MPTWLLRLLPHIGIALAVLAGVAYIDHRGYQRAQDDQAALERKITDKINDAVAEIDRKTAASLANIDTADRTIIQPTITREIASDPRYSDPACSLSGGVFDALNKARGLSGAAGASGGPVPASPAAR